MSVSGRVAGEFRGEFRERFRESFGESLKESFRSVPGSSSSCRGWQHCNKKLSAALRTTEPTTFGAGEPSA